MTAPTAILELVERFNEHEAEYSSNSYKEARLRADFLDPFFKALGWDMSDEQGRGEVYREVVYEDSIKIGNAPKAPDYSFRVGNTRKFFVEAKQPATNLQVSRSSAFQLRRYAWSANLSLSILTNFEEFAVYDGRIEPDQNDETFVARLFYFKYDEYAKRWDTIAGIFSREAAFSGALDDYIWTLKEQRGSLKVDAAFLKEIESWRDALAKDIALHNQISTRELNDAVQLTIDRIIFLRMCEDRGIEEYGQLQKLQNKERVYAQLCELFHHADQRYNSGLFHFEEDKSRPSAVDNWTLKLSIDDKPLKRIIKKIYYPDSPYQFSVMPADILGQVYEQFLGKVIRQTAKGGAVIEEKPEVKKAHGVYYTPTYISDYIIKQTVGKLCDGKTPEQVESLCILDPACGSGSFLIDAYQYLLDWHLKYYLTHSTKKYARRIYQGTGGLWFLTASEKKRILLKNIYGVDIDAQAVEVTKLSLLLKVLEGESAQSISDNLRLFHERALPDLADNIKYGNSLIGIDFYDNSKAGSLDAEVRYRINVFDWEREFSEIMMRGGFDAVIGNPPYISVELTIKDVTEYYLKTYKTAYGRANSFSLFLEKALMLLNRGGYCGFITSNRILTNTQLAPLRKLLLEQSKIEHALAFKKAVFKAAVDTTVITFQKASPPREQSIEILYDIVDLNRNRFTKNIVSQTTFLENNFYVFNVRQREEFKGTIQKIRSKSVDLEKLCEIKDGIILGEIKDLFLADNALDDRYEKWLEGNEVSRYLIEWTGRYICYDKSLIEEELKRKHDKAKEKARTSSDFQKLSRSGIWLRNPDVFRQEKILTRQNAKGLIGVLDEANYFVKNSLHCTLLKNRAYSLKYILGLINSRLMDFYFQDQIGNTGEIFSQIKIMYIEKLPIRSVDFSDPTEKAKHDMMVELVERILSFYKQLAGAKLAQDKIVIQRQIDATDLQIDRLVYDLYELTKEEIKIIENVARNAA